MSCTYADQQTDLPLDRPTSTHARTHARTHTQPARLATTRDIVVLCSDPLASEAKGADEHEPARVASLALRLEQARSPENVTVPSSASPHATRSIPSLLFR